MKALGLATGADREYCTSARDVANAHVLVRRLTLSGYDAQVVALDDLQYEKTTYDGSRAYARTKRALVTLTEMWAEQLQDSGVVVHAMHPGWADTPGVETSLPRFYRVTKPLLRSPAQGADTIVWLGAAAAGPSGRFWHDRAQRPVHLLPTTRESAAAAR